MDTTRTGYGSAIIADTNGLISIYDHSGSCHRAKIGLKKGPMTVLIPDFVLKELQKIRGISAIEIINHISSILRKKDYDSRNIFCQFDFFSTFS